MTFKELISDDDAFKKLSESFNCSSGDYTEWRAKREFAVEAITTDGSILDVGCAGGLFLRSLQEWSSHRLDPYGIDISEVYMAAAKRLFADKKDHFTVLSAQNIDQISVAGLPSEYDFMYWNRAAYTGDSVDDNVVGTMMKMVRQRLIIAVYAPNSFEIGTPEWQEERNSLQKDIDSFSQSPLILGGVLMNPTGFNQAICWFDKEPNR